MTKHSANRPGQDAQTSGGWKLGQQTYAAWIFDLDGTLTVACHDFAEMKRALRLPSDIPILEAIERLPVWERAPRLRELDDIELEIARGGAPASGAVELIDSLSRAGCRLGIVTRNSRRNAIETLRAVGLEDYFATADIMGRYDAPPKPDAGSVLALLSRWDLPADRAVLVGDYAFDIEAGSRAKVATVLVRAGTRPSWATAATVHVQDLVALLGVD